MRFWHLICSPRFTASTFAKPNIGLHLLMSECSAIFLVWLAYTRETESCTARLNNFGPWVKNCIFWLRFYEVSWITQVWGGTSRMCYFKENKSKCSYAHWNKTVLWTRMMGHHLTTSGERGLFLIVESQTASGLMSVDHTEDMWTIIFGMSKRPV